VRRQDALGRTCSDIFRASHCEQACALRRTITTRKPVVNTTASIISASGERIQWVNCSSTASTTPSRNPK
jgi:hypothetical protein